MSDAAKLAPLVWPQPIDLSPELQAVEANWLADETDLVRDLIRRAKLPAEARDRVEQRAIGLVERTREATRDQGPLDAFMQQYDLSSEEGVLLMCLAEALLRIPDKDTAEKLIRDKLGDADWAAHLGKSKSLFVNASTYGLMLTGRLVQIGDKTRDNVSAAFKQLVARSGEPVARVALRQAMRIMGHQFVMGRSIEEAMDRASNRANRDNRYSFDMLGEAALTAADAERYLQAYADAIDAIGRANPGSPSLMAAPSISVKLSALHPRYELAQRERVLTELPPRLKMLAQRAQAAGIALTMDAEEADRLLLSLEVFAAVFEDSALAGWEGLGLALQAYQKRALPTIAFLAKLARAGQRRIPIRLVKGAYWDTEIKRAQEQGLDGYPVFTRKVNTDVSYLAAARELLAAPECFYPQFATHNAHTLAAIAEMAGNHDAYEFQRLHGMGEPLYASRDDDRPVRVYAPVGSHEDLLPYLVRRLLENGANTSFVNRLVDEDLPPADLVADPVAECEALPSIPHPGIALPRDLFGGERANAKGLNLNDANELNRLASELPQHLRQWRAMPLSPIDVKGTSRPVLSPIDTRLQVGTVDDLNGDQVAMMIDTGVAAARRWDNVAVATRAAALDKAADMLEAELDHYMALCIAEAGKTVPDALAEVREAIDFCRYYALQARAGFAPRALPGPTGERNELHYGGRGVFVCISPWNFPLAIFLGQVTAALVAGNAVIAKPAEQTTLIAQHACELLYGAGIPRDVLQLATGGGADVGAKLVADPRIAGVAFTGSTQTARTINLSLARRENAGLATLIAETGGQNALLADSSALPEQLITDVLTSAFGSAGQRCSALRVLFVQEDIADRVITMLQGAMAERAVGHPGHIATDSGPVIDPAAKQMLEDHIDRMQREAKLIGKVTLPTAATHGHFVAPHAFEIPSIDMLEREVFGPILHVVRYAANELDQVIEQINATGYGLTLGVHSRIEDTQEYIANRVRVGNCYINRNIIGAVVGVQPFGGERLSGTGPKAGGPHYLHRFATERTLTVNTAAIGGNASLLALD